MISATAQKIGLPIACGTGEFVIVDKMLAKVQLERTTLFRILFEVDKNMCDITTYQKIHEFFDEQATTIAGGGACL